MSEIWPKTLPLPQRKGYGTEYQEEVLRTQGEAGLRQHRLRFASPPEKITAHWLMTEDQFLVFEEWWSVHSGMDWFMLQDIGEVRFIQAISSIPVATSLWSVNGVLEVKS